MMTTESEWRHLIGLNIDEARNLAAKNECLIRIVEEDGASTVGSCDVRSNRIRAVVRNGTITSIVGIG
jgi:hypothetical protein